MKLNYLVQYVGILSGILFLQSCAATKVIDVKSPCVSRTGGPCGPRRSINDWWLKDLMSSPQNLTEA
ncbi:MAG: hypothetical protein LBI70_02540 [Rickettsiales bacterium]|jgi:hypothetical protein|nr:hypothetical protein [Rickettsiales bacterium]